MRRAEFFAAMLACAAATLSAQQAVQYRARLSVVPIDVAMQATIAGRGSVTATLTGTTLTVSGTYKDLKSSATVVRLHRGVKMGVRGSFIAELTCSGGTNGTISGTVQLTASQVEDLVNGRLYIQLHSERAPDGNLWGWLLQEKKS
jgi:hypothetical protein